MNLLNNVLQEAKALEVKVTELIENIPDGTETYDLESSMGNVIEELERIQEERDKWQNI